MNGRSLNVFLASALGGGIGSLVALQISHAFAWVGLLVGLAVGYLSFEWKEVVVAAQVAWQAARGRKVKPSFWKATTYDAIMGLVVTSWMIVGIGGFSTVMTALDPTTPWPGLTWCALMTLVSVPFGEGVFLAVSVVMNARESEDVLEVTAAKLTRDNVREIFSYSIPVVLCWTVPRMIPSAIVATIRFVRSFCWSVFVQIHSDARLICGTDAMLGAGVGYLSGSVIAATLAGGVLGLVNYEFVTRRWLIPAGYVPVPVKIRND